MESGYRFNSIDINKFHPTDEKGRVKYALNSEIGSYLDDCRKFLDFLYKNEHVRKVVEVVDTDYFIDILDFLRERVMKSSVVTLHDTLSLIGEGKIDESIVSMWVDDGLLSNSLASDYVKKGYPQFSDKVDEMEAEIEMKTKGRIDAQNPLNLYYVDDEE